MITTDTRAMMRIASDAGIRADFDRTGALRTAIGTHGALAVFQPIFRQHRAALAVNGALYRARLAEHVHALLPTGPAGVAFLLAEDCDPETAERICRLLNRTVAKVRRAIATENAPMAPP